MKIISKNLIKLHTYDEEGLTTFQGSIRVEPEDEEDIYQLYNILMEGDNLEAMTLRNVSFETSSGKGEKQKVLTKVEIKIKKIEFESFVSQTSSSSSSSSSNSSPSSSFILRVNGTCSKENEYLKVGQFHTITLETGRPLTITKDIWDPLQLEILDKLSEFSPTSAPPVLAASTSNGSTTSVSNANLTGRNIEDQVFVLLLQEGLANLCILRNSFTKVCSKIQKSVPKKKPGAMLGYEKSIKKFYADCEDAVLKYVDFEVIKCIIIASPGFWAEEFINYFIEDCVRKEKLHVIKNKSKILRATSTSGYKSAIEGVLAQPQVMSQLTHLKAIKEIKILEKFYQVLESDSNRACYSLKEILLANQENAIESLLITDKLFRSNDFNERKKYLKIISEVEQTGGEVYKFSSLHVSGEQLNNFTGIAAILRFPVANLDALSDDEEYESD